MGQNILYLVAFAMIDRRNSSKQNIFKTFRTLVVLALGNLFLFMPQLGFAQSVLQSGGVFEVRGINVDVTAASTQAARDKARVVGEGLAFRSLLERLTLRQDHAGVSGFSSEQITSYVQDFEVAKEKASAVRYLATLNYRFKADKIRELLIDREIPFAETTSKPILILPVYQAAGALLLWDDPNPWRDAWIARPEAYSLVPTMLPQGDLADIAAIGPEQAVAGDQQRLAVIAARYRTANTLVAHGILKLDRGRPDLEVHITRYGSDQQEQSVVKSFESREGESLDQQLGRAARELTSQIEDNWKRDNLLQFGNRAVIAVTIKIGGLEDWLTVRKRLTGVAVIRSTDLVILSLDEVRINLNYIGSLQQLSLALEQADLTLRQEGDGWVLELVSGGGRS